MAVPQTFSVDEPTKVWHLRLPRPIPASKSQPARYVLDDPAEEAWPPLTHLGSQPAAIARFTTDSIERMMVGGWFTSATIKQGATALEIKDSGPSNVVALLNALAEAGGAQNGDPEGLALRRQAQQYSATNHRADHAGQIIAAAAEKLAGRPIDLLRYDNEFEAPTDPAPSWIALNPSVVVRSARPWVRVAPPTWPKGTKAWTVGNGQIRLGLGALTQSPVITEATWRERMQLRERLLPWTEAQDIHLEPPTRGKFEALVAGTDFDINNGPLAKGIPPPEWPPHLRTF